MSFDPDPQNSFGLVYQSVFLYNKYLLHLYNFIFTNDLVVASFGDFTLAFEFTLLSTTYIIL